MEKIIAERELLRQQALRQIRRIDIGKDETGIVAPGHKLAEVAFLRLERGIVDLQLLGIKTVNDISGSGVRVDVVGEIERYQRQRHIVIGPEREVAVRTRRKIRIGDSVVERARRLVDQRSVIRVLVVLPQCVETVLEAIRAWKLAVERIKAPVFLVDHDDMPQPLRRLLAFFALVVWWIGECEAGGTGEYCRSRRKSSGALNEINE